jgi:AAA ATPase domain
VHNQEMADVLGQDAVAARLLADLEADDCRLVRLTGAEGSGKSYIAWRTAERWHESGGTCLFATGDDEHSWKELFPLLSALVKAPGAWSGLVKAGTRSAIQVGETVSGAPRIGSSIFDLLTAAFRVETERALRPYSNLAREVILDMKRLARRRRLLIVADNAHWWDADSLRLVGDLISDPLRQTISELQSVSVLLVDTSEEQAVVAPEEFELLVSKCADRTHRIGRCPRDLFPRVLEACGVSEPLPENALDELFGATNGHLQLADQIARYAQSGRLRELASRIASALAQSRLSSLGSLNADVVDLLVCAAVLGLSCSEQDLQCIAERGRIELRRLVDQAQEVGFLERGAEHASLAGDVTRADQVSFTHDVFRSALLRGQSSSRLEALYLKLSECLAILRPGDYEARAQALLRAGETGPAREMVALAGVAQIRRGVSGATVLHRTELLAPGDRELASYLRLIADGYAAVAVGDFESVIPALRSQKTGETTAMAAERNYLVAICSIGLQTAAGRGEARRILSSWSGALHDEVELGLRFSILLQQAQVHSDMFEEARETELLIEQRLSEREQYDTDARVMIHVQNRRSGGIMTPDYAEGRIECAVSFFRAGTGEPRRDRRELFRSLTNLAAIEIRLDRNARAYEHALEAERLAVEYLDVEHRLDVLASNLTLAGYRSGAIDLHDAIESQNVVVHSPEGSEDNFIQRCNLTAYLLLASRDEEATAELAVLEAAVDERGLDESYLVYYQGALSVAAAAVAGEVEQAVLRHKAMDEFVASLNWPSASYIRRRQRLLAEALPRLDAGRSRTEFDRLLLDRLPMQVGRAWPYYGRLIPACELSFWVDS